jgi:hypothetical protein
MHNTRRKMPGGSVNTAQIVVDALQQITFGTLSEHHNLGILPLLVRQARGPSYLTLDEAMAKGRISITEVTEAGQVPELTVKNSGDAAVLIVDGEELVGAKQNRVINLTMLIPEHRTMTIPVSCVESGRWRHVSSTFTASPRVQFAEGRAAKMHNVTASLHHHNSRQSNQGEVWDLIAGKAARLDAVSPTSAMSSIYDSHEESIADFVRAFTPIENQVGAVFFVDGCVAGLDLFDAAGTWQKVAHKLVRSYALDAIDRRTERRGNPSGSQPDAESAARAFCASLASSPASVFPAAGEGEDVRVTGVSHVGAALVADGRAVHVSGFPLP